MADPRPLTRNQIAKFVGNDPEAIRAIERLFRVAGELTPSDVVGLQQLIFDNKIDLGTVDNKAEVALSSATAAERLADLLAKAPIRETHNSVATDYIDLNPNAPHFHKKARLSWHQTEQTAEIGMEFGVTQQIGLEYYARVENATGVTIPNGSVVGFSGVGLGNVLSVTPYLADGSSPSLYVLGIMTHDLPNAGEVGYCTAWGHVRGIDTTGTLLGETWSVGDILYASPSTAGAFTNVKPTAPDNVIPVAAVLASDATDGEIFVRPTIQQMQYYGVFSKTTDATPAATNTAYTLTFDSTDISNGVTIGTPASRIVVPVSGLYQIKANVQISSGSGSKKDIYVWFRKNGTDVPNTTRIVTSDVSNGYVTVALTETLSLDASDYIEMAYGANSTDITIDAVAATAFAPAAPSVILAITQAQQ
jgi:hypothetical protein